MLGLTPLTGTNEKGSRSFLVGRKSGKKCTNSNKGGGKNYDNLAKISTVDFSFDRFI